MRHHVVGIDAQVVQRHRTRCAGTEPVDADCVDRNADGMITTSQGPNDVLPWGEDECVLWHQELPHDDDNRHGPRPTAWDADEDNPCLDDNARVSTPDRPMMPRAASQRSRRRMAR